MDSAASLGVYSVVKTKPDWIIILGVSLIVIGLIGWLFILGEGRARKSIENTTTGITVEATQSHQAEAKDVSEQNIKASRRVATIHQRSTVVAARLPSSPDHDAAFFDGVCESGLYENDPQCRDRGGEQSD